MNNPLLPLHLLNVLYKSKYLPSVRMKVPVLMFPWNCPSTMTLSQLVTLAVRTTPLPTTSTRSSCDDSKGSVVLAGIGAATVSSGCDVYLLSPCCC